MRDLDDMAVFAAVVEAGGFSAAARRLNLSKSAVSKKIAGLEDRLGARLLDRTTRRMRLTEVGEDYYAACARIVREAEEAAQRVSRLQATPRGLLRVSAPMSFGLEHVVPAIPEFAAAYPDLNLHIDLEDRRVDIIAESYDMAIRIATLPDSTLIARRLAPCHRLVTGSPDYFERHGRPTRPEDLREHNCLTYSYLSTLDEWRFSGRRGAHAVRVSGSVRSNNGETLLAASRAGLGLTLLPTFIVGDDLRAGRLEACLNEYQLEPMGLYAVYPQGRHLSPKVRALIDFLVERLGTEPYWDHGLGLGAS